MYIQSFGLEREPFSMTPDPDALFMTPMHRDALAALTYAIVGHKGFVVLTGEAGTGKTTLLARILQRVPTGRMLSSVILNPLLTPAEFLEMALVDFGLTETQGNKTQRLLALQRLLMKAHDDGRSAVLVVDEAHKLTIELLEEIRLLSNYELPQGKLLQIVLSGQGELLPLLNRPELRQLKQRVAVWATLRPLSSDETAEYIQCRWSKAGGQGASPFDDASKRLISSAACGIPRLINALCDNALLLAFSESERAVTIRHVREAARDLDLTLDGERPALQVLPAPAPAVPVDRDGSGEILQCTFLERWLEAPPPSRLRRLAAKLGLAS
jgi:general secretion pathway protein A